MRITEKCSGALFAAALVVTAAPAQAEDPVHFLNWSYSEAASKEFMDRETKSIEQDIEMIGFPFGQMLENIVLRYRSGQPTEVMQLSERWVPLLSGVGAIRSLDGVFDRSELEEIVEPAILDTVELDGTLYGVPWTIGSIALVANGKVLEKAGVTATPETMDEFYEALKAIKAAIPDSTPLGIATTNVNFIQLDSQSIFWQFGARFFVDGEVAIDTPDAREALTFLIKLFDEGLMGRGIDRAAARSLFAQELMGFYFDPPVARAFARVGSGEGEAYDPYVYAIPTPSTGNDEPPRSVLWTHLLTIGAGDNVNVEGAKDVVAHFGLNPETQVQYWKEIGLFPTTKAAIEEVGDDAYITGWLDIATTSLLDEPSKFANSEELRAIIGEEIEAAYLKSKTADEAITDMAARLEAALK